MNPRRRSPCIILGLRTEIETRFQQAIPWEAPSSSPRGTGVFAA